MEARYTIPDMFTVPKARRVIRIVGKFTRSKTKKNQIPTSGGGLISIEARDLNGVLVGDVGAAEKSEPPCGVQLEWLAEKLGRESLSVFVVFSASVIDPLSSMGIGGAMYLLAAKMAASRGAALASHSGCEDDENFGGGETSEDASLLWDYSKLLRSETIRPPNWLPGSYAGFDGRLDRSDRVVYWTGPSKPPRSARRNPDPSIVDRWWCA